MTTEILYRDIRNEVPSDIEVLRDPVQEGNESNFTELVVLGEVVNPGISLEPVTVDVGSIEHSTQSVDSKGRYAGPGRQVSGFLMSHLVFSCHVSDKAEGSNERYETARSDALETIMTGVYYMISSQSVEKAIEKVTDSEDTARTNVWFGISK